MLNIYDYKIAHPETFKQLSVRDMLFVYYRCPQVDKLLQLYTHFNMITFTLDGSRILHQGKKTWTSKKETTVFLRKTAYIQELPETPGWEVLAFYIPDEFLIQVANEFQDNLPLPKSVNLTDETMIEINLNETTRTYFYGLISYFTQKLPPSEKLLELKFKELLLNILTNPFNQKLLAYILKLNGNYKIPIWQVMEQNYMYNLNLSEFARIAGRSLASFKRDFFEYYRCTPGKWLTEKRLEHAEMLLNSSKQSVSEVAFNSGFENVSHFSRIFKEKYGSSPLQFRKNLTEVV